MKIYKLVAAIALTAAVSACSVIQPVTRNAPATPLLSKVMTVQSANWSVTDVRVNVPRDLKVSEANFFYPIADIVWRGDAYGDRYEQVTAILDTGITNGVAHLNGPREVYFDIEVQRFHSLTEKARYFTGGVHNIVFKLTVVDVETGLPLYGPMRQDINLKAYGNNQAFEADRRGHSQKVRILSHLRTVMRRQFPLQPVATLVPASQG